MVVVGVALAAHAALVVVAVSVVAVAVSVAVVGLLVAVDLVVVGEGAGAGGGPASAFTAPPIAGGVRVAAVGSAHTIDRRAVERENDGDAAAPHVTASRTCPRRTRRRLTKVAPHWKPR
jgi:hypothetical protein